LRNLYTAANALAVLWLFVLNWGERSVYDKSIAKCNWQFENWASLSSTCGAIPEDARPHRIMFVADPQLVDPHTYPGRPWPLSTLTVKYTDLYLSRVFRKSMHELEPQTTIFLGDLFDGGREWGTADSESPEEQWHKYGGQFWLKEYNRFGNIFFKPWAEWQAKLDESQGEHKLLASLPGNHDLGFAAGIQKPVRKRFNAYFGDGNRIDIIGNHTIVSLDTVSLSAFETDAPEDIWKPTVEFLEDNRRARRRLISRQMKLLHGENGFTKYEHGVLESEELAEARLPHPSNDVSDLPLILLSHVPLYRDPGTPCGPLRERWPPTPPPDGEKEPLIKDDRNAISVSYGYQYQNVLTAAVTKKIINSIGIVQYAFSGDDHDYCDVTHRGYSGPGGGVREITVKSLSWAMGVRKPGFVQVSLWNPVDVHGKSISHEHNPTLQSNLCLLPDQLSIFIRYGLLFGFTLMILTIRAAMIMLHPSMSTLVGASDSPLLPTVRSDEKSDPPPTNGHLDVPSDTSTNSSTLSNSG
ncbi:hypothetical protein NA57DRAFT_14648, partial [Rhizodiscina lignyota]